MNHLGPAGKLHPFIPPPPVLPIRLRLRSWRGSPDALSTMTQPLGIATLNADFQRIKRLPPYVFNIV
ncbi:MAG: hypothetical protein RKP73_06480, partial [Candidatus Contendobacter sp.]|nr:hypothetical protein [Candidatus Contendobacter sp.]